MARRPHLLLALLWLALGYAHVGRGLAHTGPGYRFWSFQHLCYSDVIALHGDRYLDGEHPRPYLDDRIEYPPLLGLFLWLPHWIPGGAAGHFTVTYLLLALCLLAAVRALERTPGTRAAWLAATPALVVFAGLNWDLLPIALIAGAALLQSRGQPRGAAAVTGLGISAKLFPGVLVLPAAGALAGGAPPGRRLRALVAPALALVGVVLAVNLPVALAAPRSWAWFWVFNAQRGAENSIWHAFGMGRPPVRDPSALFLSPTPLVELLSAGPLVAASLFALWAAYAAARRGDPTGRAVRLGAALALVVWIATNKVWSPQYALYGFLAGALVAAPWPFFGLLSAASLFDHWAAFEARGRWDGVLRRWDPWFTDHVFHPQAIVRTVLWLALAAWIARELWRAARAPPVAAQPPGWAPGSGVRVSARSR
ncbi:MAG TPA: glycosyltransferase 87 family protein [Anaeromyxobacter sp.]|nr:glycosyltransferase 87 family protein [Anaeromyxobacter sp.]